jgi:methyl-accepting chemotaxis protein
VQVTVTSLADNCGRQLAEGMACLQNNNLTYQITPVTPRIGRYGADEIGETAAKTDALRDSIVEAIGAYNAARASLTSTVGEVKAASETVALTSRGLTEAASQSGTASNQVAATISQIAAGAQD